MHTRTNAFSAPWPLDCILQIFELTIFSHPPCPVYKLSLLSFPTHKKITVWWTQVFLFFLTENKSASCALLPSNEGLIDARLLSTRESRSSRWKYAFTVRNRTGILLPLPLSAFSNGFHSVLLTRQRSNRTICLWEDEEDDKVHYVSDRAYNQQLSMAPIKWTHTARFRHRQKKQQNTGQGKAILHADSKHSR